MLYVELYNNITNVYTKYCTHTMLSMLQHEYSTQKNEAMNHSITTLAPKRMTFPKSSSLITCIVMICAGTLIAGNHKVYDCIFAAFRLVAEPNLSQHLLKESWKKAQVAGHSKY